MILSELAAGTSGADWIPFDLWPAQEDVAQRFQDHRLIVALKARQLGLTSLALAFALWHLTLHPISTTLLFSRRDDEAVDLLARLRWMLARLPPWLRPAEAAVDNDHELQLPDGSRVLAFPTTAGDSYTSQLCVIDEADLIPNLDRLLTSVKPTIDAGGRLLLISRADKTQPESPFKRLYRSAIAGDTQWCPIFLPWHARPDRSPEWYAAQAKDIEARTGSLDNLHEQYPAFDAEALAPKTLDKRLPPAWLLKCYQPAAPVPAGRDAPALPALTVYQPPAPGRRYAVGADPAEGNPTSDASALEVIDVDTGEEVAALAGRYEPGLFSAHAVTVARWYNRAGILWERNNHGAACILWARENATDIRLLVGPDMKPGWLTTTRNKALAYDRAAAAFRDADAVIHNLDTLHELESVEGATLRAPEGLHDDRAIAFVLALAARARTLTLENMARGTGDGPNYLTPGMADPFGDWPPNRHPTGALGHGAERQPPWITGGRGDIYGPG